MADRQKELENYQFHRCVLSESPDEIESAVRTIVDRNRIDPFRLFVFGKTGAGKSSLINTLLNRKVAEEGSNLRSQTALVEAHSGGPSLGLSHTTINNVPVMLWDSPGLKDPYTNEEETLKMIKDSCQDIDLFIYCIRITQTRMGKDEFYSIADLTNTLGEGIWRRAVFALTFANQLQSKHRSLNERVSEWKELLTDAVKRAGISDARAADIPVVPTSYQQEPLPDVPDWYNEFWSKGLSRTKHWSKLIAMLQITQENWIHEPDGAEFVAVEFTRRLQLAALGDEIDQYYMDEIRDDVTTMTGTPDPGGLTRILIDVLKTSWDRPESLRKLNFSHSTPFILLLTSFVYRWYCRRHLPPIVYTYLLPFVVGFSCHFACAVQI